MAKIVLTGDRATLSHYHHNIYLGFLSCLTDRLCPAPIYKAIVSPVEHDAEGTVTLPNLSLRAVEAACVRAGFSREDIGIVHHDFLESRITPETKIVGITTHDPLGLGPATTTWSTIFKGTPYNRIYFLALMKRIKDLKKQLRFKVVVGGPGDWQVSDPETMKALGIDYVVMGEGEISAPKLFGRILNGDPGGPAVVEDRAPTAEEIPPVLGPSAHNLIEITRGCGRGCDFCGPTTSGNFRSLPLDKILGDVKAYLDRGMSSVTFQSDDSLRYGSQTLLPEKEALLSLFEEGYGAGARQIYITHASFVNIAQHPDVIGALTKLVNAHGTDFFGCQPGLETGSHRLIGRYMKGKVYPRDPKEWHEVVIEALKVMKRYKWYAICTLICGLPEEDAEDIAMTAELIKKVGNFEALYIPLFFAPMSMTKLKDRERFIADNMLREHWELMLACWDHNFRHMKKLYGLVAGEHHPAFRALMGSLIFLMRGWINFRRDYVLNKAARSRPASTRSVSPVK